MEIIDQGVNKFRPAINLINAIQHILQGFEQQRVQQLGAVHQSVVIIVPAVEYSLVTVVIVAVIVGIHREREEIADQGRFKGGIVLIGCRRVVIRILQQQEGNALVEIGRRVEEVVKPGL